MITAAPVHSTGLMRLITICQTGSRLTKDCRADGEPGCPVAMPMSPWTGKGCTGKSCAGRPGAGTCGSGGIAVMVVSSPRVGFHG